MINKISCWSPTLLVSDVVFGHLQDPEIMREAQKLMNDPDFQEQMRKMTSAPAFQAHMKKTQDMLKDPKKVKDLEKKMENALKEGNQLLEKVATTKSEGAKEENGNDSDNEKQNPKTEIGDDMPDIPSLNLN